MEHPACVLTVHTILQSEHTRCSTDLNDYNPVPTIRKQKILIQL
jgi:hypothetical protein